jgi:hypothetical protein
VGIVGTAIITSIIRTSKGNKFVKLYVNPVGVLVVAGFVETIATAAGFVNVTVPEAIV